MCNLPEVLTALQIKTIMTFKQIPYKEIAGEFNRSISWVWQVLNFGQKNPTSILLISKYVRGRLLETVKK